MCTTAMLVIRSLLGDTPFWAPLSLSLSPMAPRFLHPSSFPVLALLLLLAAAISGAGRPALAADVSFLVSEKPAPRPLREKLSHFRIYWHDIVSGPSPTAIRVAEAATTNASATNFGMVVVIDDPLTAGPELSSQLVGHAQGIYVLSSKEMLDFGLLMAMNLAFVEGKYNGSTIAILGRNAVFSGVREMPIVGGSGLFRLAKGYVQAKTYRTDKIGDAVVEYNVFVTHY